MIPERFVRTPPCACGTYATEPIEGETVTEGESGNTPFALYFNGPGLRGKMIEGETVEKNSAGSSGIESNFFNARELAWHNGSRFESNFFLEGNFLNACEPAWHNGSRLEGNFYRGKLFCEKPNAHRKCATGVLAKKKLVVRFGVPVRPATH